MVVTRGVKVVAGVTLMAVLSACGDAGPKPAAAPAPVAPLAPAVVVELPPQSRASEPSKMADVPVFSRSSYTAVDGKRAVALVSPTELELRKDGKTYSCNYTREGGRIRAVVEISGTKTVEYFNEVADGLQGEDGTRYFAPTALEIAKLQLRGDELKRQQQQLEAKLNAPVAQPKPLPPQASLPPPPGPRPVAQPQPVQFQSPANGLPPVEYVLQAEECVGNNDRAGALRFYDKAISLTENDGNPVQARIFATRRALIERGGGKH